jgi:transcriptional regulator with XRE-family HTH domain
MENPNPKNTKEFEEIGRRLREIREDGEWTQTAIAREISISAPMWQNYESGKHLVSGAVLQKLAIMGYDANWVLCGYGSIKMPKFTETASVGINAEILSDLIKQVEIIISTNDWFITPQDKADIITPLFVKYNQTQIIDIDEVRWATKLANKNKEKQ